MRAREFSFARYVAKQEGAGEEFRPTEYAYSGDLAMLRTFRQMKAVETAAAAAVRGYKQFLKNQYLGTTVRVGPRQLPRIHRIAERCAETLGVATPTVYVANSPHVNAFTFGTDDDAFIVLHSALIDHFDESELTFVIGHETGHIQNCHVVYGTVLQLMKASAAILLQWILPPVEVALATWYRRAEITCDRAGLLCAQDIGVGTRALMKVASGARTLYDELDVEAYLEQYEEGRDGLGRISEAFATHPYLPKRVQALRVFAESALFREAVGLGKEGIGMAEVDRRTGEILQILGPSEAVKERG
ncbi:MAG: M48 family metallopeptidase [Polyangiaceae bacterium]|nr:M48 family metallopeptidase [Polyangiaceae bacterium]